MSAEAGQHPTLNCPCGEGTLVEAVRYSAPPDGEMRYPGVTENGYDRAYVRCAACEHHFARHEMDLSALYAADYVETVYGGADGLARSFAKVMALPHDRSDNRDRVAWLLHALKERAPAVAGGDRRLLDIGAGLGVFPAAMQESGWRAMAVETDARSQRHLADVVGVPAVIGDLFALSPDELGRFDLVSLVKVIEHIDRPTAFLIQAARFAQPGGAVYLEAPDVAACGDSDGYGREEFFIEHPHVFSPQSLWGLAERAGLAPLRLDRVRDPSAKYSLRLLAGAPET